MKIRKICLFIMPVLLFSSCGNNYIHEDITKISETKVSYTDFINYVNNDSMKKSSSFSSLLDNVVKYDWSEKRENYPEDDQKIFFDYDNKTIDIPTCKIYKESDKYVVYDKSTYELKYFSLDYFDKVALPNIKSMIKSYSSAYDGRYLSQINKYKNYIVSFDADKYFDFYVNVEKSYFRYVQKDVVNINTESYLAYELAWHKGLVVKEHINRYSSGQSYNTVEKLDFYYKY